MLQVTDAFVQFINYYSTIMHVTFTHKHEYGESGRKTGWDSDNNSDFA